MVGSYGICTFRWHGSHIFLVASLLVGASAWRSLHFGGSAHVAVGALGKAREDVVLASRRHQVLSNGAELFFPLGVALALHEGVPGHHLQGSLGLENTALPDFLRFIEDATKFVGPPETDVSVVQRRAESFSGM